MPRLLVAGKLHPAGLALLDQVRDIDLDYVETISTESMLPGIYSADALVIRTQPLPAEVIEKCQQLQIVSRHGVGYDSVAVDALNQKGIPLAIVGDVNSIAVAEHTLMLMLATAKKLLSYNAACRENPTFGLDWQYRNSLQATELFNKRCLVVGYGRIGKRVTELAAAFGMQVRVYDPWLEAELELHPASIRVTQLQAALAAADFITFHIPGGEQPVLGRRELVNLKPGSVVINTARGGIVDETALLEALEDGRVSAAALDVFEQEPIDPTSAMAYNRNTLLTPHSAAMTEECAKRMALVCVQNVLDYFNGTLNPQLVVNTEHCELFA